jgi:hypothetical protein
VTTDWRGGHRLRSPDRLAPLIAGGHAPAFFNTWTLLSYAAAQTQRIQISDNVNPLGAKGIGELGIVGTAAAIANAVYHATGIGVRDLPIMLDKLVR